MECEPNFFDADGFVPWDFRDFFRNAAWKRMGRAVIFFWDFQEPFVFQRESLVVRTTNEEKEACLVPCLWLTQRGLRGPCKQLFVAWRSQAVFRFILINGTEAFWECDPPLYWLNHRIGAHDETQTSCKRHTSNIKQMLVSGQVQ